jgi:hypothetical protein
MGARESASPESKTPTMLRDARDVPPRYLARNTGLVPGVYSLSPFLAVLDLPTSFFAGGSPLG